MARFPRIMLLAALAAALIGVAAPAGSASITACSFVTGTVTATTDFSASPGKIRVGGGGTILADGSPCGSATILNTDLIQVVGTGSGYTSNPRIEIDLSGGAFAPGAADEPGSTSDEIEFALVLSDVNAVYLTVVGGSGPDHIVAGAGGLNLNAAETDDDVDVTYTLGEGDPAGVLDSLLGNGGDDILSNAGGEGTGGPWPASTLLIDGGAGADILSSGTEDAHLVGGAGEDILTGGPDDYDWLEGGADRDVLDGGAGDDQLEGGPDADLLTGAAGNDLLDGGSGGEDWAIYTLATGPVTARFGAGTAPGLDGDGGTDTWASIEAVSGSAYDDNFTGDGGSNHFFASDGNDTILAGGGDDTGRGNGGDDTVDLGPGDDSFGGDDGDDVLLGGDGDDELVDGSGEDVLDGGRGDDAIEASEWDPDFGPQPIGADLLLGGPGVDTVRYWFRNSGLVVTLDGIANDGTGCALPIPICDNVGGPSADVENIEGSDGDDVLIGNAADNVIDGRDGADDVHGLGGKDDLYGGDGDGDVLRGGDGKDLLVGGAGEDSLFGEAGKDTIEAYDSEEDTVDGGPGKDWAHADLFGPVDTVVAVETVV